MKIQSMFNWVKNLPSELIFRKDNEAIQNQKVSHGSIYYQDTISKAEMQPIDIKWQPALLKVPAPGSLSVEEAKKIMEESSPAFAAMPEVIEKLVTENLDEKIEKLGKMIDQEIKKPDRSFEKLQALVYMLVMGVMHKFKQMDQEYILDSGAQIKIQAIKVRDTYNTWPAVAITVVSTAISVAGGAAGLSPLLPVAWIAPQTAQIFAGASQALSTAGTGLGGVGSIFNSQSESVRFVLQIDLEEFKKKREDKEGSKQNKSARSNEARSSSQEAIKLDFETRRAIFSV